MTQPPHGTDGPGWGQSPAWTGIPTAGGAGPDGAEPGGPPRYGYGPPPNGPGRPRPGIIPLRPIALGEILDGAFQAIRSNPRTMLGFSAVVLVTTTLVSLLPTAVLTNQLTDRLARLGNGGDVTAQDVTAIGVTGTVTVLPAALLQSLAITVLNALLVVAVSEAVLGRQIAPGALWARVRRRVWAVLGLAFASGLLIGLLVAVAAVPGIAALALGNQVVGGILLVVLLPLALLAAVYVWLAWSLAGPALLLENQRIAMALRRSWRLVRGSWWRVFGIQVLTAIIVGVGSSAVGVPFNVLGTIPAAAGGGSLTGTVLSLLVQGIGTIIAGTIFYPFSAAVTALLYIDLRMRREGLDVELVRATGG